jgi:hypothetical protein
VRFAPAPPGRRSTPTLDLTVDTLERIQSWFADNCDGDWEHTNVVRIETLDNPGWHVRVDIYETDLHDKLFAPVAYGEDVETQDWVHCKVEAGTFHGFGGPTKLREILETFLAWAESDA